MVAPFIYCQRLETWMSSWLHLSPNSSCPQSYWLFLLCLPLICPFGVRPWFESWPIALWLSYLGFTSSYWWNEEKACVSVVVMIAGDDVCKALAQQTSFKWQLLLLTDCPLMLKGIGLAESSSLETNRQGLDPSSCAPKESLSLRDPANGGSSGLL